MESDGNYIKKADSAAANLKALDSSVKANAYALSGKADKSEVYTKTETDSALSLKADADSVYTKADSDGRYAAKDSVYTMAETDAKLDTKANKDAVYTKQEVDDALASVGEKADTANTTAVAAQSTANEAKEAAVAADSKAVAAQETATAAQSTANEAKKAAVAADGKADAAQETAKTAQSTADTAKTATDSLKENIGSVSDGNYVQADKTIGDNINSLDANLSEKTKYVAVNSTADAAQATGEDAIAIGPKTKSSGAQSLAVGYGSTVSGSHSGAFGDPNTVSGANSYAFGNNNTIEGANTFVLGNNVKAGSGISNAVVLGSDSEAVSNAVSVGAKGKERKIVNVKAGEDPTDAVNVSQLQQTNQRIDQQDSSLRRLAKRDAQLERKIERAGAHAAAIAALHPLDYDEDHKFTASAGVGQYHGSSAVAVGAFYRPTENLMFSFGASLNENDSMVNAGMSYRFGTGSGNKTSPNNIHEMRRQINNLSEENRQLSAQLNSSETKRASSDAEIQELKVSLSRETKRSEMLEAKIRRIEKMLKIK